jgi:hypothetical protein
MGHGRSAPDDGRGAWKRLGRWLADDTDDPGNALRALSDIGRVRHTLDQAELRAVKQARRHRASWAEIATRLGVTRQAAWEKWRDLDAEPESEKSIKDESEQILDRVVDRTVRRLKGLIDVPDVLGLSYADARDIVRRAGLEPANADPDAAPVAPVDWGSYRIVRQYPDPGTRLRAGSPVRLWAERGGGESGVREPRRPNPPSRELAGEVDLGAVVGE